MRIISVINSKGGTGKTTTCINVCAALSLSGFKCLLVDIDPQANLSESAGFDQLSDGTLTTYEVLKGDNINKAIVTKTTEKYSYDVLPTDLRLSGGEVELIGVDNRNYILKEALSELDKKYDFVLIDCPPSLSVFTVMALTASDEAIVPVQAQYLPLKGVAQIRDTIDLVKERFNPELTIGGIVLTFYNSRRNLDKDVEEALEQVFGSKVYDTRIGTNTKLAEAPGHGMDIIEYSSRSAGAQQYKALAKEIAGKDE